MDLWPDVANCNPASLTKLCILGCSSLLKVHLRRPIVVHFLISYFDFESTQGVIETLGPYLKESFFGNSSSQGGGYSQSSDNRPF